MVRKVVLGILISILTVFAMSYNANALETVIDLSNYDLAFYTRSPQYRCNYSDGTNSTDIACVINSNKSLVSVSSVDLYSLKVGDIVETYVMAYSSNTFTTGENSSGTLSGLLYPSSAVLSTRGDVINFEPVILNTDSQIINYYNYWNIRNQGTGQTVEGYPEITQNYQHYSIYKVFVRVRNNYANLGQPFDLNGSNAMPLFTMLPTYNSSNVLIYFPYFKVWRPSESKENKEVEEKTEEAVDQSTTDGNTSQTTVEGSTQSLMSAGGSIISALVNAPATDCNISVNTTGSSRLFTTAIGQLNLCSDVPQGVLTMVQGIVALVFTPIVLYFTYNVLTTLYNQFKEYNS